MEIHVYLNRIHGPESNVLMKENMLELFLCKLIIFSLSVLGSKDMGEEEEDEMEK